MDPYSSRLLETCQRTVEPWLGVAFDRVVSAQFLSDRVDPDRRRTAIESAASRALEDLSTLFSLDVVAQRTNPLDILRRSTAPITEELRRVGGTPIERDEFHVRSFPADVFGLCPATWADIDESLVEPGLEWGAFKAASVIQRQRGRSENQL